MFNLNLPQAPRSANAIGHRQKGQFLSSPDARVLPLVAILVLPRLEAGLLRGMLRDEDLMERVEGEEAGLVVGLE